MAYGTRRFNAAFTSPITFENLIKSVLDTDENILKIIEGLLSRFMNSKQVLECFIEHSFNVFKCL